MVQEQPSGLTAPQPKEMVDLSTPPDGAADPAEDDVETHKRRAAEKRNVARSTNRQAHASYSKEVKDSLAEGRQPTLSVREDQANLKARWHSAAKECAYKLLDLSKEGWKDYTHFEKETVHREVNRQYKFDPPLEPRVVFKYLAGHLRSSRAVWKAHWQIHGDENRHPNCPEVAWEQLIKWWATDACREESAEMASRRKLVQNTSKTGRKTFVDRMEEEVSFTMIRFVNRHNA